MTSPLFAFTDEHLKLAAEVLFAEQRPGEGWEMVPEADRVNYEADVEAVLIAIGGRAS